MTTKRTSKPVTFFTACRYKSDGRDYMHLELTFRLGSVKDALEVLTEEMRARLPGSDVSYYQDRADKIRRETGSSEYLEESYGRSEMTVRWQGNLAKSYGNWRNGGPEPASEWYAPRIQDVRFGDATAAKWVTTLSKLGQDSDPESIIRALKARPARYMDYGVWAPVDPADVDMASPAEMDKRTAEEKARTGAPVE